MAEEKPTIKFHSSQCEDKFNLLPDELKETITQGVEEYNPRVIVLTSTCFLYQKEILSKLLQLSGFIGVKAVKGFPYRTEIIFEK